MKTYDAVVVGSGPNGLAAALTLARAGHSVIVYESAAVAGGGMRSEALTRPGYIHDVCSAVHPLAVASPFFRSLPLEKFGLEWIFSPTPLAHPLDHGEAVYLESSIEATAQNLGEDGESYLRVMKPLVSRWEDLFAEILQPILHRPRYIKLLMTFGLEAILSAKIFAKSNYKGKKAQTLFAGIAAHSNAPLQQAGTAAIGLMLNVSAHARGWPFPRGGSQQIAQAMIAYLKSLGGEVQTNSEIRTLRDLPSSRWVFFDLSPQQIVDIFADEWSHRQRRALLRYRYGNGVFKMDWALSRPIPWLAKDCARAATVHVGGDFLQILESESAPARGACHSKPYVLLAQPSLFDSSRAPVGGHTAWAYCHVPRASSADRTVAIESQIERYAPGFLNSILGRHTLRPAELQKRNANLIGGDITGGAVDLRQLIFRPSLKLDPYQLPMDGYYICSASTPPGAGVHGMCGFNAVQSALGKNGKFRDGIAKQS